MRAFFSFILLLFSTSSHGQSYISGQPCYLSGNSTACFKPVNVASGGTGAATLTNHGVIVGSGTSALRALGVGTTGQLLVGSTGADPAFGSTVSAATTFSGQLIGAGTTTNDNAAAGYIGEYKTNTRAASFNVTSVTSNNAFDIDSGASVSGGTTTGAVGITLSAGDWDLSGVCYFEDAGSTIQTERCWIGDTAGNSTSARDLAANTSAESVTISATGSLIMPTPVWRVTVASGTPSYFLKGQIIYTVAGTLTAGGTLRARRVR